eukprot:Gb_07894 [translate_table: standard]
MGQDEHLLDSAVCIQFLLKLLIPSLPEASDKKASHFGSKLLGINPSSRELKVSSSSFDRSGVAIMLKVRKLLSSLKEISVGKSEQDQESDCLPKQELSSRWLALLTLEKACLSTVALEGMVKCRDHCYAIARVPNSWEFIKKIFHASLACLDTSGSVRRVGGHFKERLRELGGLDAVCDVALNCFTILKEAPENKTMTAGLKSSNATEMLESVGMLLKCMKVMENATFLSEQNQKRSYHHSYYEELPALCAKCNVYKILGTGLSELRNAFGRRVKLLKHLLEMNLKSKNKGSELSFIALVINSIKTLSELALKHKSQTSVYGRQGKHSIDGNDGHYIRNPKSRTKALKELTSSTVTIMDEKMEGSLPKLLVIPLGRVVGSYDSGIGSRCFKYFGKLSFPSKLAIPNAGSKEAAAVASGPNAVRGRRKTVKLSTLQNKVVNPRTVEKNKNISTSVSSSQFSVAGSDNNHVLGDETVYRKESDNTLLAGSYKERVTASNTGTSTQAIGAGKSEDGMKSLIGLGQEPTMSAEEKRSASFEDSQDPFAFSEEELMPVKEKHMNIQKRLKAPKGSAHNSNGKSYSEYVPQFSHGTMDWISGENQCTFENQHTEREWAEEGALLGDCLLSAVKVMICSLDVKSGTGITEKRKLSCHLKRISFEHGCDLFLLMCYLYLNTFVSAELEQIILEFSSICGQYYAVCHNQCFAAYRKSFLVSESAFEVQTNAMEDVHGLVICGTSIVLFLHDYGHWITF